MLEWRKMKRKAYDFTSQPVDYYRKVVRFVDMRKFVIIIWLQRRFKLERYNTDRNFYFYYYSVAFVRFSMALQEK